MIRSRIAPTPSGYLHTGNALNFILIWLWVRRERGILRLRIDDIDAERSRAEYIDDIFRSLHWLGIDWDEGPQTADEHSRRYSQMLRKDRYAEMAQALIATGKTFACECSRKELQMRPCRCRDKFIAIHRPDIALRISTPPEPIVVRDIKSGMHHITLDQEMKDFVIRRRDGLAAYQLASLTDDIDHGINLIIRGSDLMRSTAAQLYLSSLIDGDGLTPAMPPLEGTASLTQYRFVENIFYHHPLLTDEQGHKLSKSAGSRSLKAMRESGMSREQFYIKMSELMGLKQICRSAEEMLESGV